MNLTDESQAVLADERVAELEASRSQAVNRIVQGGAVGVVGWSVFLAGANGLLGTGLGPILVTLGGMGAGGIGCGIVGLAASHLARFGGKRGTLILGAIGGTGLSAIAHALSWLLDSRWLYVGSSLGFWASVLLLISLVVGFLRQWSRERQESRMARVRPVSADSLLLLPLLTLALGACGDPSSVGGTDLDEIPLLVPVEELRLGDVDDPDMGFSRVGNVDMDRDGNLYVMESMDRKIRVFDKEGDRIQTIGGPGEGPGEFSRLASFGVTGDTIWAVDMMLQRITLFDPMGTVLSTSRLVRIPVDTQSPRMVGYVEPRELRPDGWFMGDMTSFGSRRDAAISDIGPNDTVQVPRVLFHPTEEIADTVGWEPHYPPLNDGGPRWVEMGPTRYGVPRWRGDDPLDVNAWDGRWVVERPVAVSGEPSTLRVIRLKEPGDTVFSRSYTYSPKPYTDAALDTVAWNSARVPGGSYSPITGPDPTPPGLDISDVQRAIRAEMDFPAFQVPVDQDRAGDDGTLWLRREDTSGPTRRWLLVRPDGTLQGHLDVPRDWMIRWVSGERFVVVENDEFDVPWVLVLGIADSEEVGR